MKKETQILKFAVHKSIDIFFCVSTQTTKKTAQAVSYIYNKLDSQVFGRLSTTPV